MTFRLDTVAAPLSSTSFSHLFVTSIPFESRFPIKRSLAKRSVWVDVHTLEVLDFSDSS